MPQSILAKVLSGVSDANVSFNDLVRLIKKLGFDERVRGSHHIFSKDGVREIVNVQPKGSMAKSYQVKQVRNLILKYHLGDDKHDEV